MITPCTDEKPCMRMACLRCRRDGRKAIPHFMRKGGCTEDEIQLALDDFDRKCLEFDLRYPRVANDGSSEPQK